MVGKKFVQDGQKAAIQSGFSLSDIERLDKPTRQQLKSLLSSESFARLQKDLKSEDLEGLRAIIKTDLTEEELTKLKTEMTPEQLQLLGLIETDSTSTDNPIPADQAAEINDDKEQEDGHFIIDRIDWQLVNSLKYNWEYSDEEILDSMRLSNLSPFEKHVAIQSIKIGRADKAQIVEYVMKNLPLMMLILIPIFALILKLLYFRKRKELYIHHLIHGLHLHSFAYLLYGVSLLLIMEAADSESTQTTIAWISFFIVTAYAYLSFLRVYHQGWFKTLVKFSIAGYVYVFFIGVFFVCEMLLSVLLY